MSPQTAALVRARLRPVERRRHFRVPVALLGRYMLANHQEYACQTTDMSPGGMALVAPVQGAVGERVVVYLEHIGRVEGEITRLTAQGFALSIAATVRKREKMASQLTWLANRTALGLPEDRRHERVTPRNSVVDLRLENGHTFPVRLTDISMSGAAISVEDKLPIGTGVTLGRTPGKVVRHFQGGMAVEFFLPLSPDRFDDNIAL
jgi:c-di-GMP-binding flagellar brake protein YcgR